MCAYHEHVLIYLHVYARVHVRVRTRVCVKNLLVLGFVHMLCACMIIISQ